VPVTPSDPSAPADAPIPPFPADGAAGLDPGPLAYEPRRLHPLSPVAAFLSSFRDLFGVLIIALTSGLIFLLPIGLGLVLGFRYWSWWRFTFGLEHDHDRGGSPVLRVDSGILERSVRRIPLDRVQRVEELRKWHHRLLGLSVLRVDTAGGSAGGEVDLDALGRADAAAVRRQLDDVRRGVVAGPVQGEGSAPSVPGPASDPGPPLLRLGTRRLAAAGITGSQLLVMLAVGAWLLQLVDDVPGAPSVEETVAGAEVPRTVLSIVLAVAAFAGLWVGLAAAASVLAYHGFSVRVQDGDLLVRRGLLDVRETVVPLRRVQAVRLEQNLLRRPVGYTSVRVVTAGDPQRESGQVLVPALLPDEVARLLAVVLPEHPEVPALVPAPPVARRRAVVRRLTVAAVPAAVAVWLVPERSAGVAVAAALLVLAVVIGFDAYRGLGLGRAGRLVATRTGSLVRTTWLVLDARTQSVQVRRSFFQRRNQLGTVHLDVAGLRQAARVVDRPEQRCTDLATAVLGTVPP
jgi:putative membrane protein